ncbi:Penicillin-binding protein A [Corynebacterium heidelbergense]|uniref:penicillin-binding transpeptidase domain-containing protein n=1 Tax=Corynebacterium heidelbergense TaxID=2055947 RepID=UPI002358A536|nr:penicillin-binding protein 2 [Corynebacterium heidelbergense]WCZ35616.1 Penicillin-binding protein A [Corynebacterium heidelbergense]
MNKSIRAVTLFSFLLIVALIANLTYIQAFQTKSLAENPLNNRQFLEMKHRPRGQISAGGQVLAESVADAEGMYDRRYPYNPQAFGSVVGYASDRFGAAGIEQSQNSILTGEDDSLFAKRTWDNLTGKPTQGANVELTLLPAVQETAFNELSSKGYSGSVVAIRPSTGDVLAMASTPSFDPSAIASPDPDASAAAFNALSQDSNAPLLDRATQQTQPPGSTFKVITTAAALQSGDNKNTPVTAANKITLPDTATTLENYNGETCGSGSQTTLYEAFRRSCNAPFVQLATKNGADVFRKTANAFGIGGDYPQLGLPVETSRLGDLPDGAALGQSAIGQRDVALTPLQNAINAATIANGGVRMQPHLIHQITGADLKPLRTYTPKVADRAISKEVADQEKELMLAAEKWANGQSNIASKTGTAEHGEDSRSSKPHTWYIAFSTEADVAVAVLVENGGDLGQEATGNSVAGPIGRAVINSAVGAIAATGSGR